MADSSSLLTRCPHCDTRFRVTGKQLGIADGKVRCGHCMEVFDARSHADSPSARQSDSAAPGDNRASRFTSDPEDDLIFQDNPEEDAAEGRYAGPASRFDEDELSDSFRGNETGFDQGLADDEDFEEVDESWAEAMLQEELPDSPPGQVTATPAGDTETGQPGPMAREKAADEASAAIAGAPSPALTASRHPVAADAAEDADDVDTAGITADARPDATTDTGHSRPRAGSSFLPLDDDSPYDRLSREPVSVGSRSGSRWRGWLWSLVILALLGGLVSQAAWFQFDRLSAIPELRPWYEKACEYAGCELAPLVAMDRIQSRKLVVRTDPDDRTALLVDAVIINQAEFEQPFPAIALTFSNLNGDVVAQSVFPPEDYLAGDSNELAAMPPGTPVRIAISIRDPGRDAVNYNLRFVNRGGNS